MEQTVDTCLDELREMFPGKLSSIEFDTSGRVLVVVIDGAVPHFNYQKTLSDCMNEIYAWNADRVNEAKRVSK